MFFRKKKKVNKLKTIGLGSQSIPFFKDNLVTVKWQFGLIVKEVGGKLFVNPYSSLDDTWIELFPDGTTSQIFRIWVKENGWDEDEKETI